MSSSKMIPSKIIGMQYSLMSPEEIRQGSVVEILSKDTYTNNKPIAHGLFDIRMGVLDPGYICPTDGMDYMQSPGYFGHYPLAEPVFYTQYISTIFKILKCVCFQCSKLLINKDLYRDFLNMHSDSRWKHIFHLASTIRRCGQEIDDGCGCIQPKLKKEALSAIYAEWKSTNSFTKKDHQEEDHDIGVGRHDDDEDNNKKNDDDDDDDVVVVKKTKAGKKLKPEKKEEKMQMKLTPSIVLKIFKRISDEDITFMGFHPLWSRPEWMVCEVLVVPPPSVRPSIKPDAHQRCEDDLTHIFTQIIRVNQILREKKKNNASQHTIEDYANVLQCFVSAQYDNKLCGGANVAQRSGRPLKSIRDRLNGKSGRMRGNLMAKRVNYSARSVITADPNISILELGIPLKIAKNMTKPVVVNARNRAFLTKLVQNGADTYPGAKLLQRKKGGGIITLRYFKDRQSIHLENGDIVHRHMMNGDSILFNRQPTLHRMSMMCHQARIMYKGDTFRMNVADTKPYNADFDGDEMNLHMPQDLECDSELCNLASVKYQLVSPANNGTIIGIFQDSMLGSYLFTTGKEYFSSLETMRLLVAFPMIDIQRLFPTTKKKEAFSSFDILSQIMPPMSMCYKVEYKIRRDENDQKENKNDTLEIKAGTYVRGQLEKGVLGGRGKGLIHRICNDFGNQAASDFIDNLQNIVTEYLRQRGFSVGISDLIVSKSAKEQIASIIDDKKMEVKSILDQTRIGVFENNTGKSNRDEVEIRVNDILNMTIKNTEQVGLKSLGKDNRFKIMVDAGSKGSELNIAQMVSCVGQQNVDGKRIPYSYRNRTLPHFCQFDDSPEARGFVEHSYIQGLTPTELFFHAMGGRVGLIDTAVKTSTTGYIQRRLIKGMEDLMVGYDMTIRNTREKIIQFVYGDDGIDPVRIESQPFDLVKMSIQDIYTWYLLADEPLSKRVLSNALDKSSLKTHAKQAEAYKQKMGELTNEMIGIRNEVVANVFRWKTDSVVNCPIGFRYIVENVRQQMGIHDHSLVDISPMDALTLVEETWRKMCALMRCSASNRLLYALFFFHLAPKELLFIKRINRAALVIILEMIMLQYKRAIVAPGEMVGIIAAQSIGEPTTQLTLNTFHYAGVSSKTNVTRGVPRIEEILSLTSDVKNPSLTIYLPKEDEMDREKAQIVMNLLEHTKLADIVTSAEICFDVKDNHHLSGKDDDHDDVMHRFLEFERLVAETMSEIDVTSSSSSSSSPSSPSPSPSPSSPWVFSLKMNHEIMLEKNITMDDVHFAIKSIHQDDVSCVYADFNDDNLVFRIRLCNDKGNEKKKLVKEKKKMMTMMTTDLKSSLLDGEKSSDQIDYIFKLKAFLDDLLDNLVLRGVKDLKRVSMRKIKDQVVENLGTFQRQESWVLDTLGSSLLEVLGLDFIDKRRTFTNNIKEVYDVLGIEAARESIYNELSEVIEFEGTYINYHHLSLLVDRMCYSSKMIPISRHGINVDDIGPNAKASFEETPEMFLKAAKHGELDTMRGLSANIMCGQEGSFGTNAFQLFYDSKQSQDHVDVNTNKDDDGDDDVNGKEQEKTPKDNKDMEIESSSTIMDDKALWAKLDMGVIF